MIEFNTRQFVFSHGSGPRGRGMWWFQFLLPGKAHLDMAAPVVVGGTAYGEAKKWARVKARELGAVEVVVLP